MSLLEAREVTDATELERYERLNRESHAGSVFSSASWFAHQALRHRVIGIYKGLELVGGSVLYEVDGGLPPIVPATPWQGPVCRSNREGECLAVAECLAEYLLRRYADVTMTLPPMWPDARPFIWAGMRQQVRYTYRGYLPNRKYEKRVGIRPCVIATEVVEKRGKWVFDGQPMEPEWRLTRLSTEDSTITVLEDHKTRYLLDANRGGTWHAELIDDMLRAEHPYFHWGVADLVGCNSPQRALFKRSFNMPLVPYYLVTTLDPSDIEEFWAPKEAKVA